MEEDSAKAEGARCLRRRSVVTGVTGWVVGAALGACGRAEPAPPAMDGGDAGLPRDRQILARAGDVPVGGGVVVANILIVQPTAGSFRAFSAVCPHQGARVSSPVDGVATCWEHNSTFSIADGTRLGGPATRGLAELPISVDGTDIFVA